jgi:hypothetical protein
MTTINEPTTELAAEPVIDMAAAEQEKLDNEALMAELNARREEEAKIAAEQDAALQAVRDACNAFRNPQQLRSPL